MRDYSETDVLAVIGDLELTRRAQQTQIVQLQEQLQQALKIKPKDNDGSS